MDYDGYHPRLIGDIVDYQFEGNVHNTLAKIYFKSKKITPAQYKESKTLTFKQIYGGIDKKNLHHPFFKKTQDFINIIWNEFNKKGEVKCGSYTITKKDHPKIHSQKLFNYYIQATETETNIRKMKIVQDYLKNKKTRLVLYIYDAFVFDVAKSDGREILNELQTILSDKFPVKLKTGIHYGALS
jgi:DNA polymerase I-like protein with 3'-5' exonuclease and polymerase domains